MLSPRTKDDDPILPTTSCYSELFGFVPTTGHDKSSNIILLVDIYKPEAQYMIGRRFGRLRVIEQYRSPDRYKRWLCVCDCGKEKAIIGSHLRAGQTKSCGCLIKDILRQRNKKHGHKSRTVRSPEYISWTSMIQRCHNPKHTYYHRYGGRGIVVCEKWHDFAAFFTDMGHRPDNHTLGRLCNDDCYEPSNCRWVTSEEQMNNRSTSRHIVIGRKSLSIAQWCREFSINYTTVLARERRGWSIKTAIMTPCGNGKMVTREEQSRIGKSNVRRSKAHERRVASLLTTWSGIEFRRRRVEGRDLSVLEREATADVIPVNGDPWFSIEAKCGKPTSFDGLFANPTGCNICAWWHQSCYDAILLGQVLKHTVYPLMFFKPQPNFDWVAVSQHAFDVLRYKEKRPSFPHFKFDIYTELDVIEHDISHSKKHPNLHKLKLDPIIFCRWKDFAACVDPNSFFRSTK